MWKPIDGFEGYYEVSSSGDVRGLDRIIVDKNGVLYHRKGRTMKLTNNKCRNGNGYLVVNLRKNHKANVRPVHILVAKAFLPNPLNLPTVNHIDGCKTNNDVSNLEWASYSDNNIHALKHNLRNPRGNSVDQFTISGEHIATYKSTCEASRQTGIKIGTIYHCINHRTKSAGGFVWRKVSEGVTTISQESTPGNELPAEVQERHEPKI